MNDETRQTIADVAERLRYLIERAGAMSVGEMQDSLMVECAELEEIVECD